MLIFYSQINDMCDRFLPNIPSFTSLVSLFVYTSFFFSAQLSIVKGAGFKPAFQ